MDIISYLFRVLTRGERKQLRSVLILGAAAGLLQSAAVLSIIPFMELASGLGGGRAQGLVRGLGSALGVSSTSGLVLLMGGIFLVLVVLANGVAALSLRRTHMVAWNINHFLARRLLAEYLHRPYSWFLQRHSSRLTRNLLEEVRVVVLGVLIPLLSAAIRGIEASVLVLALLMINVRVTIIAGALFGVVYVAVYFGLRRAQDAFGKMRAAATAERAMVANEALGGIKEVKSLGVEDEFLRRFGDTGPPFVRSEAWSRVLAEVPRHVLEVISMGSVTVLFIVVIRSGTQLDEAIPTLALFGFAGLKLVPSFQQVFTGISFARYHLPSLKELAEDLTSPAGSGGRVVSSGPTVTLKESLQLTGVDARYPGATSLALCDVSFRVERGSRVGVVGPTGAGKTTLVDVLLGLLPPEDGTVFVDGEAVEGERWEAWRRAVGYVPQSIFLADDTIERNIAFGMPAESIDHDLVRRVGRSAMMHDFVESLPMGYSTSVGERGVRLSGGQRQRIGIARALYRNPSLLLLDEATSALDGVTEKAVMDAIYALEEDCTVLIVTHRLSTVRECDSIVVIEGGHLLAEGTYDQLLEQSELFRLMARLSETDRSSS